MPAVVVDFGTLPVAAAQFAAAGSTNQPYVVPSLALAALRSPQGAVAEPAARCLDTVAVVAGAVAVAPAAAPPAVAGSAATLAAADLVAAASVGCLAALESLPAAAADSR